MNKSEDITELTKALVNFQEGITPVTKGSENPFFKSKYADLDTIIEHCKELLSANGLAITQTSVIGEVGTVTLETMLCHTSGQWISGVMVMKPTKTTPQEYGSTLTYARRYGYSAILGLCTDEDDDGNSGSEASKNTSQKPPQAPDGTQTPPSDTEQDEKYYSAMEEQFKRLGKDEFGAVLYALFDITDYKEVTDKAKREEIWNALNKTKKESK